MPKKEIYQKDPEKWKKKNKESYDPSYHAEYRKKNRERINAMRRERYKNNPDYDKQYSKKRYQRLSERISDKDQENVENQDS